MYDYDVSNFMRKYFAPNMSGDGKVIDGPIPADEHNGADAASGEKPRKPRTRLSKWLAKIAGVYDGEMEPKTEAEYYLNEIAKLTIPDYSEAGDGAVLTVVNSEGPNVITILDEDLGPDSPVAIQPTVTKVYFYSKPMTIIPNQKYFLEINSDGNVLYERPGGDEKTELYLQFVIDSISYTFYTDRVSIYNNSHDNSFTFHKSHFNLTTHSIIKKLEWRSKEVLDQGGDIVVDRG